MQKCCRKKGKRQKDTRKISKNVESLQRQNFNRNCQQESQNNCFEGKKLVIIFVGVVFVGFFVWLARGFLFARLFFLAWVFIIPPILLVQDSAEKWVWDSVPKEGRRRWRRMQADKKREKQASARLIEAPKSAIMGAGNSEE